METDVEIQQEEQRAETQSETEGTGTLQSGGPKGPTCGAPEETPQQEAQADEVKLNN
jgi:hypothetical protein